MPLKLSVVIKFGIFLLLSVLILANKNAVAMKASAGESSSDTTYSGQVSIQTSILTFPLRDAVIKFSIVDTVNQTIQLVKQGATDQNGQLIIDRLPILSNFVGISELEKEKSKFGLKISNNGIGSSHGILIKTNQNLSKEGVILDISGRVVTKIDLFFDPVLETYEGFWDGTDAKTGTYIFYTHSKSGAIAGKINHFANLSGEQNQLSFDDQFTTTKLKEATQSQAKYEIEISSEVSETLTETIYVQEQTAHEFNFSLTHLPVPDASVQGVVTINRTTLAPNAVMSWSSLLSNEQFITYTDTNGFYSKDDVPVAIDDFFTNPEWDRYYLNINIGDSITFKVDPVLVFSGELVIKDCNINILSN